MHTSALKDWPLDKNQYHRKRYINGNLATKHGDFRLQLQKYVFDEELLRAWIANAQLDLFFAIY